MRRSAAVVPLVAGILLVGAGSHLLSAPPRLLVQEETAAPPQQPAVAHLTPAPAAPVEAAPVRVAADAVGVDGPVVPVLAAAGGALTIPEDPATFGWWAAGATPSTGSGSVVIVAHVDAATYGAGPMASLLRAPMQTPVSVVDASGQVFAYSLTERRAMPKGELPSDLFTLDGPARLVLITCGGSFDRRTGHYSDNVVMIGTPA